MKQVVRPCGDREPVARVLLVRPMTPGGKYGATRPPAGIGYLSEYLEMHGIETRFMDLARRCHMREVEKVIRDFTPELIGYSIFSFRHKVAYDLIREIKRRFPDILAVAGGPHISADREKAMLQCKEIDLAVTREGEQALLELCQGREYADVGGLLYRGAGGVAYTGDRPFIRNLDDLPFPKYRRLRLRDYVEEKVIISSRGCPFRCIFCSVKTSMGRRMRFRSASNVVDEIEYWWKRGVRKFDFEDDNFTFDPERVYAICDDIEERGLDGLFLRCSNGIRADRVDYDLLARMAEVGFRSIGIGVESGSNKVLKLMRKVEKIERIEATIRDACSLDYDVHLFFVVGVPGETSKDIRQSEAVALRYPVLKANFYNVIPFPMTELHQRLENEGRLFRKADEYLNDTLNYSNEVLFTTPELGYWSRKRWLRRLHGVEKEIMRRGAERRMRRWGKVAATIGSRIFVTSPVQKALFHSRLVRELGDSLRYQYIRALQR